MLFANSLQWAFLVTPMMSVGPKQSTEDRKAYYGAVLLQEFCLATFFAVLVLAAVSSSTRLFPQWGIGRLALPLAGATFGYLLQDFIRRYFFTVGRPNLAVVSDCLSYLTQLPILFAITLHRGSSLEAVLWVIAATSLLGFVGCFAWYEQVAFEFRACRSVLRRHWQMSRWLAPSAFMQWGAGNLFVMAAPVYYGAAASAALRAAQNIVAVAHVWFLGLDNIVPAEAARQMHAKGPTGVLSYLKRVISRWGGITLAFTSIVAAFPTFWLRLAYGTKYLNDGYVLRLYAVLYFCIFLSGPLRAGLQALEYTLPIFWAYPVLIGFSVALAGPLARYLGLSGVLLGMIGTQIIFQSIIGVSFLSRVRRLRRDATNSVPLSFVHRADDLTEEKSTS